MLNALSVWSLVAGFFGAGLFNLIGTQATQSGFVRWGYPRWWCHVTGALELISAAMIALPSSREAGLMFGAGIIAVAVLSVVRHPGFVHLVPLGVFVALLALAEVSL